MTSTTCRRCKGNGYLKGVSYANGVCAACGGAGTVTPEAPADKAARLFVNWAVEEGARREVGTRRNYAAHAARHLKATDPARFTQAVAAGHTDATYAALVALADEAASR